MVKYDIRERRFSPTPLLLRFVTKLFASHAFCFLNFWQYSFEEVEKQKSLAKQMVEKNDACVDGHKKIIELVETNLF